MGSGQIFEVCEVLVSFVVNVKPCLSVESAVVDRISAVSAFSAVMPEDSRERPFVRGNSMLRRGNWLHLGHLRLNLSLGLRPGMC